MQASMHIKTHVVAVLEIPGVKRITCSEFLANNFLGRRLPHEQPENEDVAKYQPTNDAVTMYQIEVVAQYQIAGRPKNVFCGRLRRRK